jgi:hypothetical protein
MLHSRSFLAGVTVISLGIAACESNSPSSVVSLTGTVRETGTNNAIQGATITVQNKTATSAANGTFTVTDLTSGSAEVRVTHQGHVNLTQNVALSGSTTFNPTIVVEPRMVYSGDWTGTWINNASQNKGTGIMTIALDTVAQSMTFTVDLDGLVFGIQNPQPLTFSGPYTTTGISLNVPTPIGTLTATIAQGGQITGNVVAAPLLPITRIDFTGTATPTTVTINFTLTLTGGGTAPGSLTFTKVSRF